MKDYRQKISPGRAVLLCCLSVILAVVGCGKKSVDPPAPEPVAFTFRNNVAAPIHLDIYASRGDYYSAHNAVASADISTGAQYTTPATLTRDHEYYLDWYSADYRYNNWFAGAGLPSLFISFTPSATNSSATLTHPTGIDFSRAVLLNGIGTGSSWHAVGARRSSTSVWDTLSPPRRVHNLIFNKTFSGISASLNPANSTLTSLPFTFLPNSRNITAPAMTCSLDSTSNGAHAGTVSAPLSPGSSGKDSISAIFADGTGITYILVRD